MISSEKLNVFVVVFKINMSVSGTWQAGFRSSDRFFLAISESRTLSCAAFLTCRKTSHISYDPSFLQVPYVI